MERCRKASRMSVEILENKLKFTPHEKYFLIVLTPLK